MRGENEFFLVKPKIVPFEFIKPVYAGQSAQVTCLVSEGDTPMNISWSLASSVPLTEIGITIHEFGHQGILLLIGKADAHHQGLYTCTARNEAGIANFSTFLDVHGNVSLSVRACDPRIPVYASSINWPVSFVSEYVPTVLSCPRLANTVWNPYDYVPVYTLCFYVCNF